MTHTDNITLSVVPWKGSRKCLLNAETTCECCGRPKNYHAGFYVRVVVRDGAETTFAPVSLKEITEDNFSWLDTVGTACGKRLPTTHKISLARMEKHFAKLQGY